MVLGSGWRRLWWHSYRLGLRWAVRDAATLWTAGRTGLVRLIVPLDPWRYYELGRVADQAFSGKCLDVSSPKLLPSLLRHEGKGEWLCTDLFGREIDHWRRIDPSLELDTQDATAMEYESCSFDAIVCISVLEHIAHGKDVTALDEMWRLLKPGGVLHLTTDVARVAREIHIADKIYGEASEISQGRVFFKRDYSASDIDGLIAGNDWVTRVKEFVVQRDPRIEARFYARRPWSYLYGPMLRWTCPQNFIASTSGDLLVGDSHGVVYLQLEKVATLEVA